MYVRQSAQTLAPASPTSQPRKLAHRQHAFRLAEPNGPATFDPAASVLLLFAHPTTQSTNCSSSLAPDTRPPLDETRQHHSPPEPAWRHCHSTPPKTEPTTPTNAPGTPKPSMFSLRWLNCTRFTSRVTETIDQLRRCVSEAAKS